MGFVLTPTFLYATDATSANCYLAEGFGTSSANGTYIYFEDHLSKPAFRNEHDYIFYYWGESGGSSYWQMNLTTYSADHNKYYQGKAQYNYDPTTASASWSVFEGDSPAGTIANTTCPTTSTEETATATSTQAYLGSIAVGIAVIIGMMSLGFVGFIWNRINRKKPWQK